jgi:hypothetical protein
MKHLALAVLHVVLLSACGGSVASQANADGAPKSAPAGEAERDAVRPGTTSQAGDTEPSAPASAPPFGNGASGIRYEEYAPGARRCQGAPYERFDVDLVAGTLALDSCRSDAADAGLQATALTLSPADVESLRALLVAIRGEPLGTCGYDGVYRRLEVARGLAVVSGGIDLTCGMPVPDHALNRADFIAFRAKLYVLAGLDPAWRP